MFPGKGSGPGFSLSGRALALHQGWVQDGAADSFVVKHVFFDLGKQFLSLFTVGPHSGVSLKRLGRQILSLFTVIPLSGVSLGMSWERLDN